MLINYIIIAHNKPEQLERLVRRLNATDTSFYIHIDKTVDDVPFKNLLSDLNQVYFLPDAERTSTPWSDIGFVHATLGALRRCVENTSAKGYCILLSGQDYPIEDNEQIRIFFEAKYGKNFISLAEVSEIWPKWKNRFERYNFHLPKQRTEHGIYPLSDPRFLSLANLRSILFVSLNFGLKQTFKMVFDKKREHPKTLVPKGGSAWWAFPMETVIEILAYLNDYPDFLEYHKYTHVPDETVFHTLVHALKSNVDIEESLTYVNWTRKGVSLPVTFQTAEDFKELMGLGDEFLFARKFDDSTNSDIHDRLDAHFSKGNEVR